MKPSMKDYRAVSKAIQADPLVSIKSAPPTRLGAGSQPTTVRPMWATTPSTVISTLLVWLAAVSNPAIEALFDDDWRLP